jgi:hypothetical protein
MGMSRGEVGVAVAVASAAREGLGGGETLRGSLARESLGGGRGDLVCSVAEVKGGVGESGEGVEEGEGRGGVTGAPSGVGGSDFVERRFGRGSVAVGRRTCWRGALRSAGRWGGQKPGGSAGVGEVFQGEIGVEVGVESSGGG